MKIKITKPVNTYNKPEVGKVYDVITSYVTRWGTYIRYINVDGVAVGIRNQECEEIEK